MADKFKELICSQQPQMILVCKNPACTVHNKHSFKSSDIFKHDKFVFQCGDTTQEFDAKGFLLSFKKGAERSGLTL